MACRWKSWAVCLFLASARVSFAQEPAPSDVLVQPETPSAAPLPEAPGITVEGRLDTIGSQGTDVSGTTELVSPNLTPTELANTGSSVTVITAEQIAERGGQTNVAEILRGVAGVDVFRAGPPGGITTVFLRGANSEHTKVLLDGIPINDPISSARGFDFANMSVDNIERIEILRGPQSVLYGSDAIGGVINIITKKGTPNFSGRVSGMGGAYGTSNTAVNVAGSPGDTYFSAGGSYFNTNGFSALQNFTEPDGFRLGTFSGRTGWQPSEQFNADVVVRYNDSRVQNDGFATVFPFNSIDDPNSQSTLSQISTGVRLYGKNLDGWYEQSLAYYMTSVDRDINDPANFGQPVPAVGVFHGMTQQVDSRHVIHLLDGPWVGNSVTFGGLYQTETADSEYSDAFGSESFPDTSLDDGAVYVQDQLRIGDNWYTTVGARSDHYNTFGTADTYRATTIYRVPVTNTAFRGTIGTGFRAPSLYQRFSGLYGNPALRPELSKGWDVGVEQPLFGGAVVPSVTYFRNDFTNLIDVVFVPPATLSYVNINQARTTGIEFNTLFVVGPRTTITTSYTFMNATNLETDLPLYRRPRNKLGIVFNRKMLDDRLNWNFNVVIVGKRDDVDTATFQRTILDAYTLINTGLTYDLTRHVQLFGRIDNVFNANYVEVFGYNVASASGYAGAALVW